MAESVNSNSYLLASPETKKQRMCLPYSPIVEATGYLFLRSLVTKLTHFLDWSQKGLKNLANILLATPLPILWRASLCVWGSCGRN
jgi:hypothetical protein